MESNNKYAKPIIDAIQNLEEIGGPELDEYIETLLEIKKNITKRLANVGVTKKEIMEN